MPLFLPRSDDSLRETLPGHCRYYVVETAGEPERASAETDGWRMSYSLAPEAGLEEAVIRRCAAAGVTITTAESCTGGGLGSALTAPAGSSSVYAGGVVSYSYELKERLLGVPGALLKEHGAVSEECALAMARGAAKRLGGNRQIAITGIAGPEGGTPEKPVGLVYMALLDGEQAALYRFRFSGNRQAVRERSVEAALILLLDPELPNELLERIDGIRLTAV